MGHTCALCGHIRFNTHHEYEEHRHSFHGLRSPIMPEQLSGRTSAQIVRDAESTWLEPYLVGLGKPLEAVISTGQHPVSCRCGPCFQRELDALVERSERQAQELLEAEARKGAA